MVAVVNTIFDAFSKEVEPKKVHHNRNHIHPSVNNFQGLLDLNNRSEGAFTITYYQNNHRFGAWWLCYTFLGSILEG